MTDIHEIWPTGVLEKRARPWWRDDAPTELGRAPIVLATQLVAMEPVLDADDRAALEALVLASLVAASQGSSRTPLDPALLAEIVSVFCDDPDEIVARAISVIDRRAAPALLGEPGDFKPLIVDGEWLYHQRLLHYEDRLVETLRKRLDDPFVEWPRDELVQALDAIEADAPTLAGGAKMELSAEQRYALLTSLHAPLSIITGGPGTGKTSIVVSLLRLFARLGIDPEQIALAAPTGKAAHRLGESIRAQLDALDAMDPADLALGDLLPAPRTLHRLLEYSPVRGTFRRSNDFPIDARVVVIDEASMIDLVLMERLAAAVPADAHLVLLGDAEQLPSVETGTVLRDLIPAQPSTDTPWANLVAGLPSSPAEPQKGSPDGPPEMQQDGPTARHCVRLTTSYRMRGDSPGGAAVLEVAEAVRKGDVDATIEAMSAQTDGGVVFVDVERDDPNERRAELRRFLNDWITRQLDDVPHVDHLLGHPLVLDDGRFAPEDHARIDEIFEHLQRARILCLTRVWATGSEALNALFHQRIAQQQGFGANPPQFLTGDLVLMQRNDYERGLFNGDQGLVLPVRLGADERRMAVFPEGEHYRAHHLPALRTQLDHAFAMTVHKAQGSEFDEVAVILPEEDIPLLTRELLYTGMTRCRHRAYVVGDTAMLGTAIRRPVARFTGIRDKLRR